MNGKLNPKTKAELDLIKTLIQKAFDMGSWALFLRLIKLYEKTIKSELSQNSPSVTK